MKMSESVELSEIPELENELLKQLVYIPQDLSSSSLGCILRASQKYRVFEILVILEGLKQFSPHGEVCKIYQRCRERVIADAIRDRPTPEYFLLLVGFWLVTDEFVLKHFSSDFTITNLISSSYMKHVIQFSESASSKLLSSQSKLFKTSSIGELLSASLNGSGFIPWAKLYQLAALISIFSEESPNYTPISKLVPLESSSEEEIEFWVLQEDCKAFKNSSDEFPPLVFKRFEFFLNEISPIAFSRANIALERTALSVSKRISWMIKEVLPLTTTKNMLILSNSLRLVIKKVEELSKILPSWIRDVHEQLKSSLSLVDAYLEKSCLSSILMIFNCQESLDMEFPKRPMERDSATPMIRLYWKKLASLRSTLTINSCPAHLEKYLNTFCDSFNYIFQYLLQSSSSRNRSSNLQKDLQLTIHLGAQHLHLLHRLKIKDQTENLRSKIYRLYIKLMLQFGPTEEIAALSQNFTKYRLPEEDSYLPITSDEIFNKSEAQADILGDEEIFNCQTTAKSTIQLFFLSQFKTWNPETFMKLISQRVAEKTLRVVLEDIDENIIIPVFQILHRTHSAELNVIGILAEISDNVWTLSRNTRIFLLEASKFYMLKPEKVILERVLYYLRLVNTPKNQELVLLLEQLGRSSCSLDSAVIDAYCDLTVECTESYDLVFDASEEDSPSPSHVLNTSLPLEIPELEEPLWKNMSKLSFSKADFKSFIALRHSS